MSKLYQYRFIGKLCLPVVLISSVLFYTSASWAQQTNAQQARDEAYRPYIIQNVLNRIADEAEQQGFVGWREEVQAHLEQLTTHQLNEIQSAQSYHEVTTIIRGGEINPQQLGAYTYNSEITSEELSSGPQLGDKEQDLVYTPLPPCRIVDTRVRGGKFSANQTRNYSVNGNTTSQGGASNCGVPNGVNEAAAVVLNITSTKGSSNGFLTAYPLGTKKPLASVLNYQTQDIANALVLKSAIAGLNEIAVYASAPIHVIIDVMGYLRKPEGVLLAKINRLEALLAGVTRSGNLLRFTGMNIQIEDGTGNTHGTPNGLGNLIVGYNQARPNGSQKTGSHNLIVGDQHNYSSTGGFVAGTQNTISGLSSSVSGGIGNTASNFYSSVSGGGENTASNFSSSVSGGRSNTASSQYSSVSGGHSNTASNQFSSVSGGRSNIASGPYSSVSGGNDNTASGDQSSVSGGHGNTASNQFSSVSGGRSNIASGLYSSVSGGFENTASLGLASSVSGGNQNTASGHQSSVSGGFQNTASGGQSSVSGGNQNIASGARSSVSGGRSNRASGLYSSVSGGRSNIASGDSSSVSGGSSNGASGESSSVSGGRLGSVFGGSDWQAGTLFEDD